MSETCETVKVKPASPEQGDFVVINKSDFDASVYQLLDAPTAKPSDGLKVEEIKAALAEKGVVIPDGMTLKADLAALLDAS